ncbi:MAG: UDP-N-acetylmuramoyl-tripeptide--D-alanyl-D-alanine ligase [Lysobacterales bacterium]|jgi:UDP-N-acetylmuramoyl-tripeptide--D-alanyl-D-alanine ligase
MITMTLPQAAKVLGCKDVGGATSFRGITSDSRMVNDGMMFAALSGDHVDGHDFAAAALNYGASCVLVNRKLDIPVSQLVVPDVLAALGKLAAWWRAETDPSVVAITGSNGKTTTREMVTRVLELDANVLSTAGNYNNELGLPLTLFGLNHEHRYAVLELGASKGGDIAYLAEISAPDIALITNVGPAHLQGFGNEEGVARAKGELYQALPLDGTAIINIDELWCDVWQEMSPAKNFITFGRKTNSDIYPESTTQGIEIKTPSGSFPLNLHLPGEHNLHNALAATAVALALNIPLDQIRQGLEDTMPVPGRLNLIRTENGWTVIDDTYNANPASLYAALQVLTHQQGEPWLVLGDMKELGHNSHRMHAEMGEAARALGVKRIFAVGDSSIFTVDAFGRGGSHFTDHKSLLKALCSEISAGVTCLVKGSRSMGMEQVVQAITGPMAMREAG